MKEEIYKGYKIVYNETDKVWEFDNEILTTSSFDLERVKKAIDNLPK